MKYLSKEKIENKTIILRCDLNVPVKEGIILDTKKIDMSLITIEKLLANNNKVIILSHFGRVKTEEDRISNTLKVVFEEMSKRLNIVFASDPLNIDKSLIENNSCILVENTRFTDVPNKKESANDLELASYWASLGNVFVLDAFASSHRVHSSTAGISNYLPTYIGYNMEEEINKLSILIDDPIHPFVVIMGGAKVDDKIDLIDSLIKKCDKLLLTGGILNSFLKQKNFNVGKSLVNKEEEISDKIIELININSNKLLFSKKFVVENDQIEIKDLKDINDNDTIFDNIIEPNETLKTAKLIFVNGTCGLYENINFSKGTKQLLEILNNSDANVIIGGGDTASSVKMFGYENSFYYICSGGGATLEYISKGTLPVIDYINSVENNKQILY